MRILVVEHSPTARRAILNAVQSLGDVVTVVADHPHEVLDALDPPFVLAVLGWHPGEDQALELVRALRNHESPVQTRVMVVSTRAEELDVKHAIEAGADDYLLRPVLPGVLRTRLERLCPPAEESEPERHAA